MRRILLAAGIALLATTPALSQTLVIGTSEARSCYLAAKSGDAGLRSNLETCRSAIDDPVTSQSDRAKTYVNMGILLARADRPDEAMLAYENALEIRPDLAEAHQNQASVQLWAYNRPVEAVAGFSRAIDMGVRNPEAAYLGRALAHEAMDDLALAYADLRTAIELNPEYTPARNELSRYTVHEEPRS